MAVDTLDDMQRLFAGINLGDVSVSMTINAPAAIVLSFYLADRPGAGRRVAAAPRHDCRTTSSRNITPRTSSSSRREPSVRLVTDTIEFCTRDVPQFNPVSISGYHIREAGQHGGRRAGLHAGRRFPLRRAGDRARAGRRRVRPRLSFFFNSHSDFFEEIAKFRAARRIWAHHLRKRYAAHEPKSWALRCHAQTSGVSLQAQQPEVNVIRVAYQALAAVLGGCQSLHTNSRDETLSLPTEEAVTIALRTQQVLAFETGVVNSVDPLGGSYQVEAMTDRMEAEAEAIFAEIQRAGGVIRAIEAGYFRRRIADSAFRFQSEVDARRKLIVGVNAFVEPDVVSIPTLEIDYEIERRQKANLAAIKATRSSAEVDEALDRVRRTAASSDNIMPALLHAADRHVTLGEIVSALADVFGRYRPGV